MKFQPELNFTSPTCNGPLREDLQWSKLRITVPISLIAEVYLGLRQTSTIELFAKIVNYF